MFLSSSSRWGSRRQEAAPERSARRRRAVLRRGLEPLEERTLLSVALVRDINQVDAFPAGLGRVTAVAVALAELLQFVVHCLHHLLGGFGPLIAVGVDQVWSVFLSVSPRLKRGEIFEGRGRHHSWFVPLLCCLPPRHAVLGVAGAPGAESIPRLDP